MFDLNVWCGDVSFDALAPGLGPRFSLTEGQQKWVDVGGLRFALLSADFTDVWAECPELFDGPPGATVTATGPIVAETMMAAHQHAADSVARLMVRAFTHPLIEAGEGYNPEAHMILGWFANGAFHVPEYRYRDGPPNNRFLAETVEVYRPALVKALREGAIDFEEPVFTSRWVSDAAHRFVNPDG